jgi:curved DNA-binding protein CbpA
MISVRVSEGEVMVVAAADPGGPGADLYQLLGVSREASREDIAQAWRRRARTVHPDSRPGDAAAPGRFRALAGAWHVLGDPARRAAYDQALAREQTPPSASRPPGPAVVTAPRMPGSPPLWAGPVRVEGPRRAPAPGRPGEEEIRLAVLAGLALRSLARDRDWEW